VELEAALVAVGEGGHPLDEAAHSLLVHPVHLQGIRPHLHTTAVTIT
jgi:hypothetical protein